MNWIDVIIKIVQIVSMLISIWKQGGSLKAKHVLEKHHSNLRDSRDAIISERFALKEMARIEQEKQHI